MRFAMIAVAVVVASSPSQASPSCMTQAEARQKLGAVHLYWHGPNHCWDATPSRRRLAQRAKGRERQQVERDVVQEKQDKKQETKSSREDKPQRWAHEPRWREAMSKMLPDDAVPSREPTHARAGSVTFDAPPPRIDWRDRWVEVAQRAPPADKLEPADLAAAAGYTVEPIVTPIRVMLAFLAVLLTLAVIELLFRTTIRGWRS